MNKPTTLLILDGWGERDATPDNAIAQAHTPHWDALKANRPWCQLLTHGTAVGLPKGQMGNSEVGHLTIGAGRVLEQDLTRINRITQTSNWAASTVLPDFIHDLAQRQGRLHVVGLASDGGIHAHMDHWRALLDALTTLPACPVFLHAILDGRDMSPRSALPLLTALEKTKNATLATLIGRYYGMDRDQRWQRSAQAIRLWTDTSFGEPFASAAAALTSHYDQDIQDEFLPAVRLTAEAAIEPNDGVLFMNFRADRARQAIQALTDPVVYDLSTPTLPAEQILTLTEYDARFTCPVLFTEPKVSQSLGEVWAEHGLSQLRLAETEKYAHVTFFFNGGDEATFDQEHRHLIASEKVATYDLSPAMRAVELSDYLVNAIKQQQHDVMVCNLANADMVGHSGNMAAAKQAVEIIDQCLGKLVAATLAVGGTLWITADHGNVEHMHDHATDSVRTAHSTFPVPLLYVGPDTFSLADGTLADVAPTLLSNMGLPTPDVMDGQDLRC